MYLLVPLSNLFREKVPFRWQHLIVWGGLRGSLALALALSLESAFPYRDRILDLTFGAVIFLHPGAGPDDQAADEDPQDLGARAGVPSLDSPEGVGHHSNLLPLLSLLSVER